MIAQPDAGAGGSDFTWQALGGTTYDYADSGSVGLIGRRLAVDDESPELINDIAMTGPAVSLGFRF